MNTSCQTSASLIPSCTGRLRSRALARMRGRDRPRPSSETSTTTLPPWWLAASFTVPLAGLPAARRSAGVSMPWSMLLRTMWVSGSLSFSITLLSSSVCSPCRCSSTCLPRRVAVSRTSLGKRLKMKLIGSMRIDITDSCRSRVLCSSWARACCRRSWRLGSSCSPSWPSMAWVITSSPTRLIRLSIFSTLTRIEPDSPSPRTGATAPLAGAATACAGALGAAGLPGAPSNRPKARSSAGGEPGASSKRPNASLAAGAPGASSKSPNASGAAARSGAPGPSSKKPKASSSAVSLAGASSNRPKPSSAASCSGTRSQPRSRSTVSSNGTPGSGLPLRWASSRRCNTSRASRKELIMSGRRCIWPQRMRSSRVSSSWVTAVMSSKPNIPLEPLIECAARKMPCSVSLSGRSRSRPIRRSSRVARCSSVSSKNTWRNWLISWGMGPPPRGNGNQGRTLRVTSSSFGGSNGFTSQPVAPALRPCCFIASLDSVVSMRIGTLR